MKLSSLKCGIILLFVFCSVQKTTAQESSKGYKETLEMNADEQGDITVVSNIKYNASTWDFVKQRHGTDPSVLKNVFKKAFPKYQLTDFDIKNDDMERTSIIKFKILGSLKVDANGKWMAELDSKNPNITKITETQFLMVDEASGQTSKINLPSSASDAKIVPDAFGKAILTYSAPVSGGGLGNIIKYLGFVVIAAGGFLLYKNKGVNTMLVGGTKKIDFHKTKNIDDAIIINTPAKENIKNNSNPHQNNS